MQRDMDLCREVLRQMADFPSTEGPDTITVEGRSEDEIAYHLHIMRQAGLIEAIDANSVDGLAYIPQRLTWAGNEFLQAARDDTVWARAKGRLLDTAGALTFDLLLAALKAEIKSRTGLDV